MRKLTMALVALLAVVGAMLALTLLGHSPANASGATISVTSKTEKIVSARCYQSVTHETYYYHWTSKTGWTRYPKPATATRVTTTCH